MPPGATQVFEKGDRLYIVGPATVVTPSADQIEEFAFSANFKKTFQDHAPNPRLLWMHGQYVEADNPNGNGAMWTSDELSIASLTPNFMPVTVMHDPRMSVGLIADTSLLTPQKDSVPRARIDSHIAVWAHRYPEVALEVEENARQGSLMQSMECFNPSYDCSACGMTFQKQPHGEERANWCAHLKGESGERASRILRGVNFTGVGLIFGTRGVKGAMPTANLELEEVAAAHEEFHQRSASTTRPKPRSKDKMDIEPAEFARLTSADTRLKEIEPKAAKLDEEIAARAEAERKLEASEIAKKAAETERDALKQKVEQQEETARQDTLAKDRTSKLGSAFREKLTEGIRAKLDEQAKTFTDEDWTARLEELAELTGVQPDAKKDGETTTATTGTTPEEIASMGGGSTGGGGGGNGGQGVTPERRRSVLGGLAKTPAKK